MGGLERDVELEPVAGDRHDANAVLAERVEASVTRVREPGLAEQLEREDDRARAIVELIVGLPAIGRAPVERGDLGLHAANEGLAMRGQRAGTAGIHDRRGRWCGFGVMRERRRWRRAATTEDRDEDEPAHGARQ